MNNKKRPFYRFPKKKKNQTPTFWRFTWCAHKGGLVIADTIEQATSKLAAKFGKEAAENATIWAWDSDEYYDSDHPDVFDCYDAY